jgi:hypothetical protein
MKQTTRGGGEAEYDQEENGMKETPGESYFYTAKDIARERLEAYLEEKLSGEWDEAAWEFYTFLLEQAKKHRADSSGYRPAAYQDDEREAHRRRGHRETA